MNIQFNVKDVEVNDEIKKYATEKVSSLLKFLPNNTSGVRVDVKFSESSHAPAEPYRTDMVIIAGKIDVHAVGHGETLQAAIDIARDELARRLTRSKDKNRSILRRGRRLIKKFLRKD